MRVIIEGLIMGDGCVTRGNSNGSMGQGRREEGKAIGLETPRTGGERRPQRLRWSGGWRKGTERASGAFAEASKFVDEEPIALVNSVSAVGGRCRRLSGCADQ